jgi:hypothetical protein
MGESGAASNRWICTVDKLVSALATEAQAALDRRQAAKGPDN